MKEGIVRNQDEEMIAPIEDAYRFVSKMRNSYYSWLGEKVSKTKRNPHKEPKPFKSGLKENTVKGLTINPNTGNLAFTFQEDDSVVDCHICEKAIKITITKSQENALFFAIHSARYILEDLNYEEGREAVAKLTGLPMGVIIAAFENIFNEEINGCWEEDNNQNNHE